MRRLTQLTVAVAALMLVAPADGSAAPVCVQAIGIKLGRAPYSVDVTGSEEVDRITVSKPASNAWQVTAPGGVIAATECAGGTVSPYQTCGCTSVDAVTANCTSQSSGWVIGELFGGPDSVRFVEHVGLVGFGRQGP